MFSAILILLVMPFTDLGRSRGLQFRPLSKLAFYVFVANFLILMQLGAKHVESPFIEFGQVSTVLYFSHFLIIVPLVSLLENSLIELRTTATKKNGFFVMQKIIFFYFTQITLFLYNFTKQNIQVFNIRFAFKLHCNYIISYYCTYKFRITFFNIILDVAFS